MTTASYSQQADGHGPAQAPVQPVQSSATNQHDALPKLLEAGDTVPLPWDAIARYLAGQGLQLNLERAPRQFAGGLANLNYLVEIDGREHVLRRPPLGEVLPGANDMAREHRVLQALAPHHRYAPQAVQCCADTSVMGVRFQTIEYRAGRVVSGDCLLADIADPAVGKSWRGLWWICWCDCMRWILRWRAWAIMASWWDFLPGRDVSNRIFYRVLHLFKLIAAFMQLHARIGSRATIDPSTSRFGELSQRLLEFTHDLAPGRPA